LNPRDNPCPKTVPIERTVTIVKIDFFIFYKFSITSIRKKMLKDSKKIQLKKALIS
jgi:hypothetical protein